MAKIRSIIIVKVLLFISINALYEDQIGTFDWKRSYIGKVNHATFNSNKRLIVTTDENVLASLNPKNGQIQWRQLLENPSEHTINLLYVDKDITVVSGTNNVVYIRGFDIPTGSILFEWTLINKRPEISYWNVNGDEIIQVTPVSRSHLEINIFILKTGENKGKTKKITAPWIEDPTRCQIEAPYFACVSNGQLYHIDLLTSNDSNLQAESLQKLTGSTDANLHKFTREKPSLLLTLPNGKARIIQFNDDIEALPYDLPSSASNIYNSAYFLEGNPENPDKLIRVRSLNLGNGKEGPTYEIEYPRGLGAPQIIAGICRDDNSCDLLLSSSDNALSLIRIPDGKVSWTREEALSNIVAAEFFELPVSELDASIENEFKTQSGDVISMLCHRLSTQGKQLYSLLFGGQLLGASTQGLIRDEFGLHKLIVIATSVGKLFAVDTLTGSIVWSYRLPNVATFKSDGMLLLVQRTARYAPFPARCVLLARDSTDSNSILFEFDPITGVSTQGLQKLNYKIKQSLLLPHEDDEHVKPILIVDENDRTHIYPEANRYHVSKYADKIFLFTLNREKNALNGYRLDGENLKEVWNSDFRGSTVIAMSTRPHSERVHSQGRVLHDRSVYYKYVNPNLIAIATLTDDPIHKHVLSVYLIDGITGLVLYATSHHKSKGPVHLVHSENWLVYSFFNERYRRTEIAAAELYEGHIQSNSTAFSSYAVSLLPQVQTQSYILPATPQTMTVTLTERGITNKFLLVGLSCGGVVEVPWMLLQPRFPDIPCGPEENCIPYMPEVPLPAEAIINYNQTIGRMKGILVAPARLESTSHVLVYGLDLFYTRVAPSKTFDVLKEDFDHRLIVLVLSGLIVASYVTKYFAAKKALTQAWK